MADFQMTEAQWSQINSALMTAAGACTVHAPDVRDVVLKASFVMDDIVDAAEDADYAAIKPLSTYPEDRDKMLALCAAVEKSCDDDAAIELADLVKGILEDEAA